MTPILLVRIIKATRLKKHIFIHDHLKEDVENGLIPNEVVEKIYQNIQEKYLPPTRGWTILRISYDGKSYELEERGMRLYEDSDEVKNTIDEYENTMVRLGTQIFGEV